MASAELNIQHRQHRQHHRRRRAKTTTPKAPHWTTPSLIARDSHQLRFSTTTREKPTFVVKKPHPSNELRPLVDRSGQILQLITERERFRLPCSALKPNRPSVTMNVNRPKLKLRLRLWLWLFVSTTNGKLKFPASNVASNVKLRLVVDLNHIQVPNDRLRTPPELSLAVASRCLPLIMSKLNKQCCFSNK